MAMSPATELGLVSAEAPVCAEPTLLHLAPAFQPWSVLAQGQLPLCDLDAASALLVPTGGAGGHQVSAGSVPSLWWLSNTEQCMQLGENQCELK